VTTLASIFAGMARRRAPHGGARLGASRSTTTEPREERVAGRRRVTLRSYLRVALATTFNILAYAVTLGRYVWLEGRVRRGVFLNWGRRYRYEPKRFVKPTSEEEIVELVKSSASLRVFGSGHSFNGGVVPPIAALKSSSEGSHWCTSPRPSTSRRRTTAWLTNPHCLPVPCASVDRIPAMLWASCDGSDETLVSLDEYGGLVLERPGTEADRREGRHAGP
jgi:hypothetical protein